LISTAFTTIHTPHASCRSSLVAFRAVGRQLGSDAVLG
jgi:hypothetical protein